MDSTLTKDPDRVEAPPREPMFDHSKSGLRALVVDDKTILAGLLADLLRVLGYSVEIASSAFSALDLLRNRQFDVALVDVELRGTSGFAVIGSASKQGLLRGSRVIFCSDNRNSGYHNYAARFPGCSFLWRPFSMEDLVECLVSPASGPAEN